MSKSIDMEEAGRQVSCQPPPDPKTVDSAHITPTAMPELTNEQLAEIEARAVDPTNPDWRASRCGHNFPIQECPAPICLAREARADIPALITHISGLHEKIEQLERLEASSAREAERERKRAEFWRGHCERRAELIDSIEWADGTRDMNWCPVCQGEITDGHRSNCDLVRLMQMPEEPKP